MAHFAARRWYSGNERDRLFVGIVPGRPRVDVAAIANVDLEGDGRGAVAADFDGDGDLDLAVRSIQPPKIALLRNDGPGGGSVEVRVSGRAMGVGARVTAQVGSRVQARPVMLGTGYLSQGPLAVHFGIGRAMTADRIEVRFASGATADAREVPAGSIVEATEGVPDAAIRPRSGPREPLGGRGAPLRPAGVPDPARLVASLAVPSRKALSPLLARSAQARPLLLTLWAPWCATCREELPGLSKWAAAHRDVTVVGIAVDGAPGEVEQAARELGVRFPVGALSPAEAASLGSSVAVPSTYLFAPDGTLRRGFIGRLDVRALNP